MREPTPDTIGTNGIVIEGVNLAYQDVERTVRDVMDEAGYKVWVTTRKGEQGFGIHWHEDVNYDVCIDW